MNGPFEMRDWGYVVVDADGNPVVEGVGNDETNERANAEMACAALNAVYYAAKATGSASPQVEDVRTVNGQDL